MFLAKKVSIAINIFVLLIEQDWLGPFSGTSPGSLVFVEINVWLFECYRYNIT